MALSKQAKIALWTTLVIAFIFSGLTVSAAWFKANRSTVSADVTGSVVEEYFHCGNGTASDPYVITRPIHYYHLVEFYQRKTPLNATVNSSAITNNFGSDYLYFQVGFDFDNDGDLEVYSYNDQGITDESKDTTLNMAYYSGDNALMPIGTDEVPFIGSFDGGKTSSGGITIANLNIRCSENIPGGTRSTSDVGVFGYVADSDGEGGNSIIKNAYFYGLSIDLTGVASGSDTASTETSVSHVETHSEEANVGYIVGHLHNYTNYDSSGPTNASPIFDVYVNNTKVQGGAGVKCGYGYVGKVDYVDNDEAGSVEEEVASLTGGGSGHGSDWGGSIDMRSLNKRIYHFMNLNKKRFTNDEQKGNIIPSVIEGRTIVSKQANFRYYTDDYQSYSTRTSSASEYNNNPDTYSGNLVYRFGQGGAEIRDNGSASSTTNNGKLDLPDTFIPLQTDESHDLLESNTGYISASGVFSAETTVRISTYTISNIGLSVSPYSADAASYDTSKLEILSNTTKNYVSGNYARIDNGNTGDTGAVQAYPASISVSSFGNQGSYYSTAYTALKRVMNSQDHVHGLHFTGQEIDKDNYAVVPSAYLNGSQISNYKTLKNSVDFTLKENGVIKFFAGSYGLYSSVVDCDSFFSLHVVNRSSSNIASTPNIYYIYANANPATKGQYPHLYYDENDALIEYGYTSANVTRGSLEFDMRYLHNAPPVIRALYYFEIPVNQGEYALGSVSSAKTKGAYLIYLDIGATAAEETVDSAHHIAETSFFSQIGYSEGAFFTGNFRHSCFNIAYVIPDDADKNNFYVYISVDSSYSYNAATYTCYQLEIKNETGNALNLYALLVDDDGDNNNDYLHMYTIAYNGAAAVPYTVSQLHQLAAYAGS